MTFEEFAAERLPGVLRFAAVLTGDRGVAEDLAQEVLIRAHARWGTIGGLDRPEYYVRKMILNEFLHWRRREWRQIPSGAGADVDHRSTPDHASGYAERDALIAELGKLPARQRAVLALRYYEGLGDIEIADLLGCKPGTVRGYATRALAALRVEMNVRPGQARAFSRGENLMPTEDDVRIAFRDLERHTPDAADVLRAVYRSAPAAGPLVAPAAASAAAAGLARGPGPGRGRGGGRGRGDRGDGTRAAAKVKPVAAATLRTHLLAAIDTASGDILYAAGGPAPGGGRGSGPRIPSPVSGCISTPSASGRAGPCSRTGSIPSRCPP